MQSVSALDRAGRRRSPATLASFHEGRTPHNKGLRYPPDPPTVEEIISVMRSAGDDADGVRLRALIILWRAGLRISEALALAETDLDPVRGAILVRQGKGGKRREVGMDRWAWEQLEPWIELRKTLPVGAFFCILHGATRGRRCSPASIRAQLHRTAAAAGVRRRFAPHQLRHAHAVEMSREGVPLVVIQRQLGHYAGDLVKGNDRDTSREVSFALATAQVIGRDRASLAAQVESSVRGGQSVGCGCSAWW
jgi:integrase